METAYQSAAVIFNLKNNTYSLEDIHNIYRHLASTNHPDHGGSSERMQEINSAYHILTTYFKTDELLQIPETKIINSSIVEIWQHSFLQFIKLWYRI